MTQPESHSSTQEGEFAVRPSDLSHEKAVGFQDTMLSVDFSTPLAGPARVERIRQMSRHHPAFEKSRFTQEILVKIQHSLRRMPGVSSTESNEIITQLQEVGQIISQETSQFVDALMNLTLDQEDTDKATARMGLEASLSKAEIEDQTQVICDLRSQLDAEKDKRKQAEEDVKKVMSDLHELSEDFRCLKERAARKDDGTDAEARDDMIKGLEDTIRHLEDQVNNRRSLWVMKHADPQSVARAIETLADSVQDNQAALKTIMSMKAIASQSIEDGPVTRQPSDPDDALRPFGDMAPPARPPSVFQPFNRPSTVAPPKFGPLQTGPPRAPSAFSHDRRYQQGSWSSGHGRGQSNSGNPFHVPVAAPAPSAFTRPPTRKSYHNSPIPAPPRFKPSAAEFHPSSSGYSLPDVVPPRPGTAYGHHATAYSTNSREYYPQTPTSANRNRHGRFNEVAPTAFNQHGGGPEFANSASTAMVSRRTSFSGPLIHMTERSVSAWNESIMDFYSIIRAFVERHATIPDPAMAMKMSTTSLWPVLLATYHPLSAHEAASYLDIHLRQDNPKCCLVTRVIIDYIVNRVWVPNAWVGSDSESTYALLDLEKDLEKTQGQPSAQRQPLLDRQAHTVSSILKHQSVTPSFHKSKVEDITTALLSTINPLLNRLTNPSDAYRDLEQVAEHAWDLSSKILTSRLTFDFRFPEVGSRFSSQSMLPIWPAVDPIELQAKHWRVALVTTPVITCRNDTGSNISAHSVALADVYCMQ